MKKSTSAILVAMALASGHVSAATLDNLSISGFGSGAIGIANNDAGYAGYGESLNTKQDSLLGLQFNFQLNENASVTTQLVANGRYNFEPSIEVAYLSYQVDNTTIRGGKIRAPLFMYSDYLDVGYAYPMLRPSQEVYENLIISSLTGIDMLIPIEIGHTTLQLQPFFGTSQIESRDSNLGEHIEINNVLGLTANWFIDDWTVRGSYAQAETGDVNVNMNLNIDFKDSFLNLLLNDIINNEASAVVSKALSNKEASFISLGTQYNNGALLFNAELMQTTLEGFYPDVQSASALVGYQINNITPYIAAGWIKTSDDEDRNVAKAETLGAGFNYTRQSYSVGTRWDFARNVALKMDVTYVEFDDLDSGYIDRNSNNQQDDSVVYSMSLDFVF